MTVVINEAGNRHGKLLIGKRATINDHGMGVRWHYKCDCGHVGTVRGIDLRKGKSDCGCTRNVNLVGKKYGKLLVVSPSKRIKKFGVRWLCKCDCGNMVVVRGSEISRGKRTCGCWKLPAKEAVVRRVFYHYKSSAKRRGINFSVPDAEFRVIIKSNCFYCGVPPSNSYVVERHRDEMSTFRYTGIDRVDSRRGYVLGNVVPCCRICNLAKRNLTYREFTKWIDRLKKFRRSTKSAWFPLTSI